MSDHQMRMEYVIRHWIELDEPERFEVERAGLTFTVERLFAEVVDGSLSYVTGTAWRVLRSGARSHAQNIRFYAIDPVGRQKAYAVLRAYGVEGVPDA